MEFIRYHDGQQFRTAIHLPRSIERTRTRIVIIDDGALRLRTVDKSEERYMAPLDLGKRQQRNAERSLRRLMRKAPKSIRAVLA